MRRQQHIADTEGRRERFGERIDINDLLVSVDALQRGNRAAIKTEFAVVIIFDDVAAAFFFGPTQKLVATADRHDDACGELVRRTDVQNVGTAAFEHVGANAMLVHGQIAAENIVGVVDGGELWIAGVFERVDVAAAKQLHDEVIERLRACADDNLLGADVHAAELVKMLGERLAQGEHAACRSVADERELVGTCERVAQKARPDVVRKSVGRHAALGKACEKLGCVRLRRRDLGSLHFRRRGGLLDISDVVTALGLGVDVAFDDELRIGVFDGDDADAKVFGERTLRGQLVACVQHTARNVVLDAVIEMCVHALAL